VLKNWLEASRHTLKRFTQVSTERAPIVFLDQRWPHHGRHSRYLVHEGIGPSWTRHVRAFPHPLVRRWTEHTGDALVEQRLLLQLMLQAGGAKVLHVVDGDFDTWIYAQRLPGLRTRITATFHQTVDVLPKLIEPLRPGMLDGIVCVSRNQIPLLEHLVPEGRCVFVPHGVDTDFFTPAPQVSGPPVLLSVGAHRRDFVTLTASAKLIKAKRPDAIVRCVGPADKLAGVAHDGVLELRTALSDEALRAEYRNAVCLLLPL
jgi:glycosyltransferase involved in cell wall biosynthesis